MKPEPKIIVALDYHRLDDALTLVDKLDPNDCRLKIGKALFTAAGPAAINACHSRGFQVFLDLKFHDIPNTVADACKVAADLGVWMLDVHCLGGMRMMLAAREAVGTGKDAPLLIGVTILTSMTESDLHALGLKETPAFYVNEYAKMAHDAGLDGVVCSPQEVAHLRKTFDDWVLVTPGIRLADADDDQRRVMSPKASLAAGSSYLVMGRPIRSHPEPAVLLRSLR